MLSAEIPTHKSKVSFIYWKLIHFLPISESLISIKSEGESTGSGMAASVNLTRQREVSLHHFPHLPDVTLSANSAQGLQT